MTKKIFAMFLAVLMVVSMLPTSVFAANECPAVHTKINCEYTQVGEPVAPTCGSQGYTRYKCNACGKEFIADQVPAAGEHTWKDADPIKETCENNYGWVGGKECEVCHTRVDATKVDEIPNGFKCDWEDLTPTIDCTTGGKKQYQCKVCGDTKEGDKVEPNTPHAWSAWELKKAATATEMGLAERECENCGKVEKQDVFFAHDHVFVDVPAVDAKCDTVGTLAYKLCRICGGKFQENDKGEMVQKTDAELTVKTLHEALKDNADCLHLTTKCGVCQKVFNFAGVLDHKWKYDPTDSANKQANCLEAGVEVYHCETPGCTARDPRPVAPLGHATVTKTVEATCVQYGYTYTYCVRPNCTLVATDKWNDKNNNNYEFKVPAPFEPLKNAITGVPMYLSTYNAKEKAVEYLDGTINAEKGRLNVTKDVADAAQFYIETVEGGYYVYTLVAGVKYYVWIQATPYALFKMTTETPKTVWTWSETYKTLVTTVNGDEYGFTSRNGKDSANYVYALGFDYFEVTNPNAADNSDQKCYIFQFYAGLESATSKVLEVKPNYVAGKNPENHDDELIVDTAPTCKVPGMKVWVCGNNCGVASWQEEVPMLTDHNWVADTSKDCDLTKCTEDHEHTEECDLTICTENHVHIKNGEQKATCTEKGKKFLICGCCDECNESKEEEIAAKGHSAIYKEENGVKTDVIKTSVGSHTNTTIYDYKECYYCHAEIEKHNFRIWEGKGKIFEYSACNNNSCGKCAQCAHEGKLERYAEGDFAGSCTAIGYITFKCTDTKCGEIVRVAKNNTGKHLPYSGTGITVGEGEKAVTYGGTNGQPMRVEPTCTVDGYYVNYKCSRCGELIDKAKEENEVVVLKAPDHTWKELTEAERVALGLPKKYEAAPHDAPNYTNWTHKCEVCNKSASATGALKNDGTEKKNEFTVPTVGGLCGPMVYEWYKCHCGENHMRNFVGEIKHTLIDATDKAALKAADEAEGSELEVEYDSEGNAILKKDPTCTEAGYIWKVCKHCGEFVKEAKAKIPHVNKAEEKFTDACTDKVTDRHCVVCCASKCVDKDNKKHDCVTHKVDNKPAPCGCVVMPTVHNWDRTDSFVPSACGSLPYSMRVCLDCGKTEITNYAGYWDEVTVDDEGKPVLSPIVGLGHYPVAVTEDTKLHANLKYEYVTEYIYELDATGKLLVLKDGYPNTYKAIYKAYTAPTYTTAGSATFVCKYCNEEVTIELPKLSGLGFELEYINANGHEEVTMGSLVNVTLYANGNNVAVNNFDLTADFGGMIFVGAQPANDDFTIRVTDESRVNTNFDLRIIGTAVNSADKKQQDIIISEKTALVTLQFVILADSYIDMSGVAQDLAAKKAEDSIKCNPEDLEIEVQQLLDFNEDGVSFQIADLVQAEAILTGESEETYDVVIDMDKDGEITLYDLELVYNFMVNFDFDFEPSSLEEYVEVLKEMFEFIGTGLSEEHMAIVMDAINAALEIESEFECNSSDCDEILLPGTKYCPECGNRQ